jgi:hypothetical protein
MQIEVSIGEVVDKWTILCLKVVKIDDPNKLLNVEKEKDYLSTVIPKDIMEDSLAEELHWVNKELWVVEDRLREYEKAKMFNDDFVQLARSVYLLNDKRARIKKQINIKYGSDFVEEKSYKPY